MYMHIIYYVYIDIIYIIPDTYILALLLCSSFQLFLYIY